MVLQGRDITFSWRSRTSRAVGTAVGFTRHLHSGRIGILIPLTIKLPRSMADEGEDYENRGRRFRAGEHEQHRQALRADARHLLVREPAGDAQVL